MKREITFARRIKRYMLHGLILITLFQFIQFEKNDINIKRSEAKEKRDYFYVGSGNEIYCTGKNIKYYSHAYTDIWNNIPKSAKKHVGELTIFQQRQNAFYLEYKLTRYGIGKSGKWTKQAVAAMIGNIVEESKTNPGQWERWNVIEGDESGYGICQWTPSKLFLERNSLKASKANKLANKKPNKCISQQLKYMWKTMSTKDSDVKEWFPSMGVEYYNSPFKLEAREFVKSKKKPGELAKVFCASYLRPYDITQKMKAREKRAIAWYYNREIKEHWYD